MAATALAACGGGSDPGGDAATDADDSDRDALDTFAGTEDVTVERIAYGDHPEAFGDLWRPEVGDGASLPVVVFVHGGFWRQGFGLDLMDGLCQVTAGRLGVAAWNIEYRRVGGDGGWPTTLTDVAAALDHLAEVPGLDVERVAVVGHSAGGHLATWLASRPRLPTGAPGADPVVRPVVAFPQAGVLDLVACAEEGIGGSSCPDLLGGEPDEVPDRYAIASPAALVPIGVPVIAVHGSADSIVPVRQSEDYVAQATAAGDPAEVVLIEGADHFDVIDPGHPAFVAVLDRLPVYLGR